jgi:hypothetical protein
MWKLKQTINERKEHKQLEEIKKGKKHYEKLCLPKSHCLTTRAQKKSYTTIVQLSIGYYN